eukprot:2840057-Pyramimonas_sp.AAC.1
MSDGGSGGWGLLRFVSYNPLALAAVARAHNFEHIDSIQFNFCIRTSTFVGTQGMGHILIGHMESPSDCTGGAFLLRGDRTWRCSACTFLPEAQGEVPFRDDVKSVRPWELGFSTTCINFQRGVFLCWAWISTARGRQTGLLPVCGEEEAEADDPNFVNFRPVLQVHDLVLVNTFRRAGPTYFGIRDSARRRLDYVALPRSTLGNVAVCQLPRANMEACNAALLYGHKRTQLLQGIEQGLDERMSEFQDWEYVGDVGSINAGLLQIVGDCTARVLNTTPGFEESDELRVAKSRKLSQLLLQRRDAKQKEYEVPEDINLAIISTS